MGILLKALPKTVSHSSEINTLTKKSQCVLALQRAHALSQAGTFDFLLTSNGPHKTCHQQSSRQWQLDPGSSSKPVSKAAFSLTSQ